MIAKCAQQRILFKTSPQRLSIESTNTPSQTRIPSTATTTTTASRTHVPRDEQRAENNPNPNTNPNQQSQSHRKEKKKETETERYVSREPGNGMECEGGALFVIGEEWLDGSRVGRQRAVERIESMKSVFWTARRQSASGCGGIGGGGR